MDVNDGRRRGIPEVAVVSRQQRAARLTRTPTRAHVPAVDSQGARQGLALLRPAYHDLHVVGTHDSSIPLCSALREMIVRESRARQVPRALDRGAVRPYRGECVAVQDHYAPDSLGWGGPIDVEVSEVLGRNLLDELREGPQVLINRHYVLEPFNQLRLD